MRDQTYSPEERLRAALLGYQTFEQLVAEHQQHPQTPAHEVLAEARVEPSIPEGAYTRLLEAITDAAPALPPGAHARMYAALTGQRAPTPAATVLDERRRTGPDREGMRVLDRGETRVKTLH